MLILMSISSILLMTETAFSVSPLLYVARMVEKYLTQEAEVSAGERTRSVVALDDGLSIALVKKKKNLAKV